MKNQYTADDIRKRPGLFVRCCDIRGVYHLVFEFVKEIIKNSHKANVFMEIHLDECETFNITCTFFTGINDLFSLEVIKALSCIFDMRVEQDSFKIKFKPDREIFSYDTIEYHKLFGRLKELAQLNKNMKFLLANHENKNVIQFHRGLESILLEGIYDFGLTKDCRPLNIDFSKDDIEVSISAIYTYAADVTLSYVNHEKTQDGGTHVQGLLDGIFYAFQEYIQNADIKPVKDHPLFYLKERVTETPHIFDKNPNILMEDVIENLNFVISVLMPQPAFVGSVRRKLTNEEVYSIVKNGVMENMGAKLDSDQSFLNSSRVVQKAEIRKILL